MAEGDIPSPGSTLIFFLLSTLCFLFFTVFTINQAKDIESINNAKDNNTINSIYLLIIIVGSYFLNVHNSRIICAQNIEWTYILTVTLVPWLIIFVLLYFVLKLFPGWVSPFSNTVGYAFVSMLGITSILDKLLTKIEKEKQGAQSDELIKAINNINNNRSKFINQFDINLINFDSFTQQLSNSGIISPDDRANVTSDLNVITLYKLLTIKYVIGLIVWYILAGILISSISYNYSIGISCEKSVEQIIADYEKANKT